MAGARAEFRVGEARTEAEIARCAAVMRELRPHVAEADFVERVRAQMREGYRLAALEDEGGVVWAVAGFRLMGMLATGRTMYVDDLVTAAAGRSRGYGRAMLGWLQDVARAEGCATFSLDSGTQRQEAHAFYLRERLRIVSFHFARRLD